MLKYDSNQNQFSFRIYDVFVCNSPDRAQALNACGWAQLLIKNNKNESFTIERNQEFVKSLEQLNDDFKKVAMAVFHFDFDLAYQYICNIDNDKSKEYFMEIQYFKSILLGFRNIEKLLEKDLQIRPYYYYSNDKHKQIQQNLWESCQDKVSLIEVNNVIQGQKDIINDLSNKYIEQIFALGPKSLRYQLVQNAQQFLRILCSQTQFKQPYLQAISDCLTAESFEKSARILNDISISFFDRLGFALRFCQNDTLKQFLESYEKKGLNEGLLELISLEGNSEKSIQIIQTYLDLTSDIQTVGLAAIHLKSMNFPQKELLINWFKTYREFLNKLQLWDQRVILDRAYNQLEIQNQEKTNKLKYSCSTDLNDQSISLRCQVCTCSLTHNILLKDLGNIVQQKDNFHNKSGFQQFSQSKKAFVQNCLVCLKQLPNCSICLLPVQIINSYKEFYDKQKKVNTTKNYFGDSQSFEDSIVWCQTCKHGGHYSHIVEWFDQYQECPVTDCPCQCQSQI